MDKRYILSFLSIIATVVMLTACNSETASTISQGVSVESAKQMLIQNNDVVFLDVRTPKEFAKGHIAGAVNINIHDPSFSQAASTLARDKTYIVHCAVNPRGGRGDKSISILNELGFTELLSLDGGLNAWKRAGLPINQS